MLPDEADTPNKKRANGLVAASCAGVLAVYAAGYVRTKSAVDRFEAQAAERRAALPDPRRIVGHVAGPRYAMRTEPATAKPLKLKDPPPHDEPRAFPALQPPAPPAEAFVPPAIAPSSQERERKRPWPAETPTEGPASSAEAALSGQGAISIAPEPFVLTPPASPEPSSPNPPAPSPPESKWKDGTYLGWGTSRHGNIQAEVIIEHGRIVSATIAQCRTRYSCSVIDRLPPQVAQRQSPDVDYVSGATQSADAFYFAVVDALSKAQ